MCWVYPLVVIDQAAPVQHVHHGLKAEDGLFHELCVVRGRHCLGSLLDGLVLLCPGKLLLPYLCCHNILSNYTYCKMGLLEGGQ